MVRVAVHHIAVPDVWVVVDVPHEHSMSRHKRVPSRLLPVFENEILFVALRIDAIYHIVHNRQDSQILRVAYHLRHSPVKLVTLISAHQRRRATVVGIRSPVHQRPIARSQRRCHRRRVVKVRQPQHMCELMAERADAIHFALPVKLRRASIAFNFHTVKHRLPILIGQIP